MNIDNLHRQAAALRAIRRFFDDLGFVEVRTPILSADSLVDRHVEPLALSDASLPTNHHGTKTYYLQTSPEFAMKRLLAAGMTAIYQITPAFRKGDRGKIHNVEFTMLEWYRIGDDYHAGIDLLAQFAQTILGKAASLRSFQDIFLEQTGIDPYRATAKRLRTLAGEQKIAFPDRLDTEGWIDLIFSELVQPSLDAVIVYDFPAFQSQLAQTRTGSDGVAVTERFELFIDGVELANGYHELLDAVELRRRFREANAKRRADGNPEIPVESRLMAAMKSGFPACCGTALGLERLFMVQCGADSIDEVFAFPIEVA